MLAEPDAPPTRRAPRRDAVEVRIRFPSDPLAVRSALGSVLQGLSYLQLSDDVRGTLELVLAEALNNVVKHAHGGRGDGAIEVRVEHQGGQAAATLLCELIDDGAPMPGGSLPETCAPEIPPGSPGAPGFPEGGWGWLLIRELTHDIDYARCGDRNRLRFRLDVVDGPSTI